MSEVPNFDDVARMLTERIVGAVANGGSRLAESPEESHRQAPIITFSRRLPEAPPRPLVQYDGRIQNRQRRNNTFDLTSLMPVFAMAFAVILKVGPGLGVDLLDEFKFALSFVRVLLFTCIILGVVGIYLMPAVVKLVKKLTAPVQRPVLGYNDPRNRPILRGSGVVSYNVTPRPALLAPPSPAAEAITDNTAAPAENITAAPPTSEPSQQ